MELISHAATILPVKNMPASLEFYCDILGFTPTYLHEQPVTYAVLKLNEISLHLSLSGNSAAPSQPRVYFFVHDVDVVHQRIAAKYTGMVGKPTQWDYGMNDFEVADPDGHLLIFGRHRDAGSDTANQ